MSEQEFNPITARLVRRVETYHKDRIYVSQDFLVTVPHVGETTIHMGGYIETGEDRKTKGDKVEIRSGDKNYTTLDSLAVLKSELERLGIRSDKVYLSLDLPVTEERGVYAGKDWDYEHDEEEKDDYWAKDAIAGRSQPVVNESGDTETTIMEDDE